MSLTDSLLVTILGTLIVWSITTTVLHKLKKGKLREALLTDIKINIEGVKEQQLAVTRLVDKHAVEGHKLPYPILYRMGEYIFYKSIQNDLANYLNKEELLKVIQFYQKMWELDSAINGLASIMSIWEKRNLVFSSEHVDHLKKRKERIDSYCEVICSQEIKKLLDLPDSYLTLKGTETVVS